MAYELNAFVGRMDFFSGLDASASKIVPLRQSMALVPLTGTFHRWVEEHYKGPASGSISCPRRFSN
jgi:hypothetical protein